MDWGLWPPIVLFTAALYVFDPGRSAEYATFYRANCRVSDVSPSADNYHDCYFKKRGKRSSWSEEYRVDYERQRVIRVGPFVQRFESCEVADRLNWTCKLDQSYVIRSSDGSLHSGDWAGNIGWWEHTMIKWDWTR